MNVNIGKATTHTSWTMFTIPTHVISRLHTLSHHKHKGLTFRYQNKQVIIHEDNEKNSGEYETYDPSENNSEDDTLIEDDSEIINNEPITGVNRHQLQYQIQAPNDIPWVGEPELPEIYDLTDPTELPDDQV